MRNTWIGIATDRAAGICAEEQDRSRHSRRLKVDREAIARALVNLVNNTLKYSDNEKFLGVRLYREQSVLKLEVSDRGIGIERNEQARIFEKFYRTCDPLVHNTKGSGLGLSLVRHITRAHGGDVEVESTPDAAASSLSRYRWRHHDHKKHKTKPQKAQTSFCVFALFVA